MLRGTGREMFFVGLFWPLSTEDNGEVGDSGDINVGSFESTSETESSHSLSDTGWEIFVPNLEALNFSVILLLFEDVVWSISN